MRSGRTAVTAVALVCAAAGCSPAGPGGGPDGTGADLPEPPPALTISAAASLAPVVDRLEATYELDHPGTDLVVNLGSTTALDRQIREGAPVDVVIAADDRTTSALHDDGLAGEPVALARNRMAVLSRRGPAPVVRGLDDLPSAGVVALCSAEVPCGRLGREVLSLAGVVLDDTLIALGTDAAATTRLVTDGDAAAAVVYLTDAQAAVRRAPERVAVVTIPDDRNATTTVTAAVIARDQPEPTRLAADAFLRWLAGTGRALLVDAGFEDAVTAVGSTGGTSVGSW